MKPGVLALTATVLLCGGDAIASGVAYPTGNYARLALERTVIVWDATAQTEHFIRKATFDGDSATFGFFVPTPTQPKIAKEKDGIIDGVEQLAAPDANAPKPPSSVDVVQRVRIDDYDLVTVKASDENVLNAWLDSNHFIQKPSLREWAKKYVQHGWMITAMRYAAQGDPKRRTLETPVVRFSFHTEAPFYPYSQPPTDWEEENAFFKRAGGACAPGDALCARSMQSHIQKLDVRIIGPSSYGATEGVIRGPTLVANVRVSGASLAKALGDTKAWGFDPGGRGEWTITHLTESTVARLASTDVTLTHFDLPKPRPGEGINEVDERFLPPAPQASLTLPPESQETDPAARIRKWTLGLVFVIVIGAIVFALAQERVIETDKER